MACDAKRQRVVGVPGVRFPYNAMAYNCERDLTIQFSGLRQAFDTWAWDGDVWTLVRGAAPTSPAAPVLACDSARHRVAMYGGMACSGQPAPTDTWASDGVDWKRVATTGPGERMHAPAMAYDRAG